MSNKCQRCGDKFKIDFLIPDDLWEKIKPDGKPMGGGLLCGKCITTSLEKLLGYSYFKLFQI